MKIPWAILKVPAIVLLIFATVASLLNYGKPKETGDYTCIANSDCISGNCINGWCRNRTTFCGDYYCDAWEDCSNCAADCGNCRAENGKSCRIDGDCISTECVHGICRPSDPFEGDGYCDTNETCWSSPLDCGYCHWI